ncbi:MAG TPA: response regulator transcription factor [bacterium]|nr:response regulator transcription factor [bacterium]
MMDQSSRESVTIAVVEPHALYRDLLRTGLSAVPGFEVVGTFADGESARSIVERSPAVAVIDVDLQDPLSGIQLGLTVKARAPRMGVVWLADHFHPYLAIAPGRTAAGWAYLLKRSTTFAALARAIEETARGLVVLDPGLAQEYSVERGRPLDLTRRQGEMLGLMAAGFTNRAIAGILRLSGKSIENRINQLYQRLLIDANDARVQPRVQAVLAYTQTLAVAAAGGDGGLH